MAKRASKLAASVIEELPEREPHERDAMMTIVGTAPLLMHNAAAMAAAKAGGKKVIPTPEEEAERGTYWTPDRSSLAIPADNFRAMLITASKGYRIQGRRSIVPYICGCISIFPEMLPLNVTTYDVDVRTVVVMHNRITRARAKIFPWKVTLTVRYDAEVFSPDLMATTFKEIVTTGGRAVGLLDFRPEKRGRFGRFKVESWEL